MFNTVVLERRHHPLVHLHSHVRSQPPPLQLHHLRTSHINQGNNISTIHNHAELDDKMNSGTEINARLREMKQMETQMNNDRMQVLDQRRVEDADWYQRVQAHDAEEAVSRPMPVNLYSIVQTRLCAPY